jgi:DNA-binding NarL/FixJ family response regulator
MVADLRDLDVEGILLSAASAESVFDCIESMRRGPQLGRPYNLLRHLATGGRSSQVKSDLRSHEAEIVRNKEIARELYLSKGVSTAEHPRRCRYRAMKSTLQRGLPVRIPPLRSLV